MKNSNLNMSVVKSSILESKFKDVKVFMKSYTEEIRNEIVRKHEQLHGEKMKNKLKKIRQNVVPITTLSKSETIRLLPLPIFPVEVLFKLRNPKSRRPYLSGLDLENMRLVSKNWRYAVDKHYVKRPFEVNDMYYSGPMPRIRVNSRNINNHILNISMSPPLQYSVQSFILDNSIEKIHYPTISQMLAVIGNGICLFKWHMETDQNDYKLPCAVKWYKNLNWWLLSMPNLKEINLSFKINKNRFSQENYRSFSKKLDKQLSKNPFPSLNKLEVLKVGYNVPTNLVNSALFQNPNIEVLKLGIDYPEQNREGQSLGTLWSGFSKFHFNCLTELYLKDFNNRTDNGFGGNFDISLLKTVNWPLKTLKMDFSNSNLHGYTHRNLEYLFAIANNFSSTLGNLTISNAGWTPATNSDNLQLLLPHLEHLDLTLEFRDKQGSQQVQLNVDFDFLLDLAFLRNLQLHLIEYIENSYEHDYLEEVVQLQGYFNCLYASKIWNLFPALDTVSLSTYCQYEKGYNSNFSYNRKGYQHWLHSLKSV